MSSLEEGVTAIELATSGFYLFSLTYWFIETLLIKRERIIESKLDFLFLYFMIIVFIINPIIAISNDVLYFDWLREYLRLYLILFYFPLKAVIKDESTLKKFVVVFILSSIVLSVLQVVNYYLYFITNTVYAYQIITSGKGNQTYILSGSIISFLFVFYSEKLWIRILALIIAMGNLIGLISTFSRTFWVMYIVSVILIFFYLNFKNKFRFIVYLFFITIGIYLTLNFVFQDKFKFVKMALTKRFVSTGDAKRDVSVRSRYVEWDNILRITSRNSIGGMGLNYKHQFQNILERASIKYPFIHNGYLYYYSKLGLPLAIVYYFIFFGFIFMNISNLLTAKTKFMKFTTFGNFLALGVIIFTNFTSTQIHSKDCISFLSISYGITCIIYQINRKETINLHNASV